MKYFKIIFCFLFFNAFSQHENIQIFNNLNCNEPSIAINPLNTNEMVAGSNLNIYYYSDDGGFNWQNGILTSDYGVWGDPCIIVDTAGSFYFFHLSNPTNGNWIDRIVCQKSNDGGETWSSGTFMGLNGSKIQDKEWAVVDRSNNNIYIAWTQFDKYGSSASEDSSMILFSRSTDGGENWDNAIRLSKEAGNCLDDDNTTEGAVPCIGLNGEIYIAWTKDENIYFDKSLDYGETWLENDKIISQIYGGWNYNIPGIMRANGMLVSACDTSQNEYGGRIYLNWSDQKHGEDDTDVWLIKSDDGGENWSAPKRVNDDPAGKHQFSTWMTLDQVTGYIYIVFYDRRNYDDLKTDVYMAVSKDGGENFTNFKISESPFTPNSSVFFGDYTNISAYNNVVRPIWTRLDNFNLSLWTAIIDTENVHSENFEFLKKEEKSIIYLKQNFPNPFFDETIFNFKLKRSSEVTAKLFDVYGNEIIFFYKELKKEGNYIIPLNAEKYNLKAGVYYFSLENSKERKIKKVVLLGIIND